MTALIRGVLVYGAGKVGRSLGRAWRGAGLQVTVRAARLGWPKQPIGADVVVVAVRDAQIRAAAEGLAQGRLVGRRRRRQSVVHCAGALGPEVLAVLRGPRVAVAQMHPLCSFAAAAHPPPLAGGMLLVRGDAAAVRVASRLGRLVGMRPQSGDSVDPALYHAAAALVANGAAALAGEGASLLQRAGLAPEAASWALGALLRTVADNVASLGLPDALTGPVRRGDHQAIEAHLAALARDAPGAIPLYLSLARTQADMAAQVGDASPASLRRLRRTLNSLKSKKNRII